MEKTKRKKGKEVCRVVGTVQLVFLFYINNFGLLIWLFGCERICVSLSVLNCEIRAFQDKPVTCPSLLDLLFFFFSSFDLILSISLSLSTDIHPSSTHLRITLNS